MLKNTDIVLVSEAKLVLWLHAILKTNPQMGLENLQQHVSAVIDLWRDQNARGLVVGESPRKGAALKGLLRRHKRGKEDRKKFLSIDKGIGTLADGYRQADVLRIANYFFEQGSLLGLRSRLDFLLGHAMLCRSEDKRNALLANLCMYELEDEGPTRCHAIVLNLTQSKTNQEGRNEVGVTVRHKDVAQCPVGALAFYLFHRFHLFGEDFPDLSTNQAWYSIFLFRDRSKYTPLTYAQQWKAISTCFADLHIQSSKKTHAMRGQGEIFRNKRSNS